MTQTHLKSAAKLSENGDHFWKPKSKKRWPNISAISSGECSYGLRVIYVEKALASSGGQLLFRL